MTGKDRRGTIRADISSIKDFIETHYNVYSRDVVQINGLNQPLVISISMKRKFIVSLGSDVLYTGGNIVEAIRIYNLDIEGLKEVWVNINPEKRNTVSHLKPKGV